MDSDTLPSTARWHLKDVIATSTWVYIVPDRHPGL